MHAIAACAAAPPPTQEPWAPPDIIAGVDVRNVSAGDVERARARLFGQQWDEPRYLPYTGQDPVQPKEDVRVVHCCSVMFCDIENPQLPHARAPLWNIALLHTGSHLGNFWGPGNWRARLNVWGLCVRVAVLCGD